MFVESLVCTPSRRDRVVAHDLETGQSWSLGTFTATQQTYIAPLQLSAGAASLLVEVGTEAERELHLVDTDRLELVPIEVPDGRAVGSTSSQLVPLGARDVLVMPELPAMLASGTSVTLFTPLDDLASAVELGPLGRARSGGLLCSTAKLDDESRVGLVISDDHVVMHALERTSGAACAFSADGGQVMFGDSIFDLADDTPLRRRAARGVAAQCPGTIYGVRNSDEWSASTP